MNFLNTYNLKWNTQSKNASESMPFGGHDIGCNVWVEDNNILIYMAQSGTFDECGRMVKAGRIRISLTPNPFERLFQQELKLYEGYVRITGENNGKETHINLWVDVHKSVINIDISSKTAIEVKYQYESWRGENSEFENKDIIVPNDESILFCHRNQKSAIFDERVAEQGIESISNYLPNVEHNRTYGGIIIAENMEFTGVHEGQYIENVFLGYSYKSKTPVTNQNILVYLHLNQTETLEQWNNELNDFVLRYKNEKNAWHETKKWWENFWNRSYVYIKPTTTDQNDKDWQVGRNYQLFRYMLACNAYGEYPTKFNGSLFTIDPKLCSRNENSGSGYPDDRDWGGLIFTAQNQRLVYWPMLKNGDFDMMPPQFKFYTRMLEGIKKRTEFFFGITESACYPEQIDANGLSAFYGKFGLDCPLQVRYHHIQSLEFGFMILNYAKYTGYDISEYIDFIASVINYYDKTYNNLDEKGKRIIFPSTALETYHAALNSYVNGELDTEAANYNPFEVAVTNPADVIAAMNDTLKELLMTNYGTDEQRIKWEKLLNELPPIPKEIKNGYEVISPCEFPKNYVKQNCEIPQLNTAYPYNTFGLNKPNLLLAVNTYKYAWDHEDQLWHTSWHQNGIFAARLGLLDEARKYMWLKLADSNRRCPAFWGPGHDYVPDFNWGGSGMIGVQEMLMQDFDNKIYLLPTWPKEVDVSFKLHASYGTVVEVEYKKGLISYKITPESRKNDVVIFGEPRRFEDKILNINEVINSSAPIKT